MPKQEGIKKSEFIAVATVPADATLDFVTTGGENQKITQEDFYAASGVTGIIVQAGNVLGTPVLDTQGSVNNIRNLEDGSGISTSVSPENGIIVEHNFNASVTGLPVMVNPTAASPVIVSLLAGTGIGLAASTNEITISATGTVAPTNTVVVNLESDFPIQDATTITLSAGVRYVIGADISTAKRFICEDGFVLTAENQFGSTLTYTGTGDMFTGLQAGGTFEKVSLDSPNANQTFNMSDVSNTKILLTKNVSVVSTPKWGTFTGFLTVQTDSSSSLNADDGVTITGTGQLVTSFQEFGIVSTSATIKLIDFGSSIVPNIELNNLVLIATGGFLLSGLASNGNVPANSLAMLTNSSTAGGAVPLENIAEGDFRWEFLSNTGIADTHPDGLASIITNATETVISGSSTDGSNAVKMAGTWTVEGSSHFTVDATGRITYNGERGFTAPIDAGVNVLMASASTKNVSAYIAINGTVIRATEGKATPTSSLGGKCVTSPWQHTFSTGDYAEVFLENQSDTVNIIGQSGANRVN